MTLVFWYIQRYNRDDFGISGFTKIQINDFGIAGVFKNTMR